MTVLRTSAGAGAVSRRLRLASFVVVLGILVVLIIGIVDVVREGEIELGAGSTESDGSAVVSTRRFLGCVEGAEPDTDGSVWVPYLRRPLPPRSLSYSPVFVLLVPPLPLHL
uniref:Uncharacterized protein n=1 Tax=Opuntia streptacantha TaxID=393608 RepID=A0A7C9FI47_OPUST